MRGVLPRAPRLKIVFMRGVPPRAPRLKIVFMRGVPPRAPRLKAPLLLLVWCLPHRVVAPRQEPKIPRSYTRIFRLDGTLGLYVLDTPGVGLSDNATVRLDLDNEPQPDALLRIEAGGQTRLDDDGYIEGSPELVAEVAASGASYDLHDKLHVYQRNGVREYIVWRTVDQRIDWFELTDGAYRLLPPDDQGVTHSNVFPGLALAINALLAGELHVMQATLRDAMATA